jgi:general secretion pathway protein D
MLLRYARRIGAGMLLFLLIWPSTPMHANSAKKLYKQGMAAEDRGDLETAFQAYSLAQEKAPTDLRYKVALARIRATAAEMHVRNGEKFRKDNNFKEALVEFFRALEIDSSDDIAEQEIKRTKAEIENKDKAVAIGNNPSAEDLDEPGPPVRLETLSSQPITLNMVEDSRILYQTIGRIAGVSVLVDPDFNSKRVTLNVKDVTPREALRILGELSNSFWTASTHNTIYVAQNTRAKRQELQEVAVKTFYLSNVSQQSDLSEVLTTLRNVLAQEAKTYAVPGQNAIVVRGTPDEILLAKQLIASLDLPKPEVLVDVYVMEVSRDKVSTIGISPPTSLSVTANSSTTTDSTGNTVTNSTTLNQLGRSSSYSYTIGQAQAEMLLTDSDTRVLQNPSVRAIDGQKATLNIGQRIPVATGSFTTPTTTTSSSVQTQFQYIDVGVNIELTPTVHENRDVTMKVHVEISSQTGTDTISGVAEPVISQEKAEQVVRMKDGEASVMAGLVQKELALSVSGWPGLGEIPGVKYLFSTQQKSLSTDELVFMLVPHVVREFDGNAGAAHEFSIGSNDSVQINRIPTTPPSPMLQGSGGSVN